MKDIKISYAKEVSQKSGYEQIIILGIDPKTGAQHVTTYGKSKNECKEAAIIGNWLKRKLGWDEKDCHAKPSQTNLDKKQD